MSIPSSSDEVATRQGSWPRLEQLLDHQALLVRERAVVGAGDLDEALLRADARRVAFPACSVAGSSCSGSSFASSFRRLASRSAPRRLLTKMIVEVCSRTSFRSSG